MLKTLCSILAVPRHHLRLVGTAKGLVRGHLRVLEPCLSRGGEEEGTNRAVWIDGMEPLEPGGHSISPICAHLVRVESNAKTVLVVEKETVFHRLLDEGVLERHRPCIIVTARGFPDVPTRHFLARLCSDLGKPKLMVLTDWDASGLSIGMTYAFGPRSAWMQENLAQQTMIPIVCPGGAAGAARYGLAKEDVIPLTARDNSLAMGLERRLAALKIAGTPEELLAPWEDGVRSLLQGGVKFELDAMSRLSEFVDDGLKGMP